MKKFLGEELIDIEKSDYKGWTVQEWATFYIEMYGGFDGAHHKDWVLDQVVRILKGTPVIVTLAKWDDGHSDYRYNLGEPTKEYLEWVTLMEMGGSEYSEGIAP